MCAAAYLASLPLSVAAHKLREHLFERPWLAGLVERLVFFPDVVLVLVVDVDKGALDVCQALELALQRLADVVGVSQRDVRVHDDVDFDVEVLAGVIGAALSCRVSECRLTA